jgi:hypothetical protein
MIRDLGPSVRPRDATPLRGLAALRDADPLVRRALRALTERLGPRPGLRWRRRCVTRRTRHWRGRPPGRRQFRGGSRTPSRCRDRCAQHAENVAGGASSATG